LFFVAFDLITTGSLVWYLLILEVEWHRCCARFSLAFHNNKPVYNCTYQVLFEAKAQQCIGVENVKGFYEIGQSFISDFEAVSTREDCGDVKTKVRPLIYGLAGCVLFQLSASSSYRFRMNLVMGLTFGHKMTMQSDVQM
jgi:hypothetical protein